MTRSLVISLHRNPHARSRSCFPDRRALRFSRLTLGEGVRTEAERSSSSARVALGLLSEMMRLLYATLYALTNESIAMNALTVILLVEVSVIVFCLIMLWVVIFLRRTNRGGKHRRGAPKVHRLGSSVAALREREGADGLPYYPD